MHASRVRNDCECVFISETFNELTVYTARWHEPIVLQRRKGYAEAKDKSEFKIYPIISVNQPVGGVLA